jgi:hypothetical protein
LGGAHQSSSKFFFSLHGGGENPRFSVHRSLTPDLVLVLLLSLHWKKENFED